jgi:hypothetical protein
MTDTLCKPNLQQKKKCSRDQKLKIMWKENLSNLRSDGTVYRYGSLLTAEEVNATSEEETNLDPTHTHLRSLTLLGFRPTAES